MNFQPADPTSLSLFVIFAIVMYALIFMAFLKAKVSKKFIIGFNLYLLIFSIVVASGIAQRYVLPVAPLIFASVMVGAIYFAFGKVGNQVSATFGLSVLLGFQGFRLLLELILHQWAEVGTIPGTMTWTGQNWDILSGIVSFIGIPFVEKNKFVAWGVQMIGFALLVNVIRVVMMSSPFPFSWPLENPLQLVLHFPYALIGPLFVGSALFGHLVVFRKLLGGLPKHVN